MVEKPEECWYCGCDMCVPCWEQHGVCCPSGDTAQLEIQDARSHAEIAAIFSRGLRRSGCDHDEH